MNTIRPGIAKITKLERVFSTASMTHVWHATVEVDGVRMPHPWCGFTAYETIRNIKRFYATVVGSEAIHAIVA